MTASAPPPLPADLNEGLKRLKMAAMRRLAPELVARPTCGDAEWIAQLLEHGLLSRSFVPPPAIGICGCGPDTGCS